MLLSLPLSGWPLPAPNARGSGLPPVTGLAARSVKMGIRLAFGSVMLTGQGVLFVGLTG